MVLTVYSDSHLLFNSFTRVITSDSYQVVSPAMNPSDPPHHASLSIFSSHRQHLAVIDQFHGFSARRPLSSASPTQPQQPPTPGAQLLDRKVRDSALLDNSTPSDGPDHLGSKDKSVPRDALTLLSCAISNLAKSADHSTSSPDQRTKVCAPDLFNGSDSRKLCTFLVQCELNFQNHPRAFRSDHAKVTFAQFYLKGMALGWFEPDLLLADNSDLSSNPSSDPSSNSSELRPLWMENYQEFVLELQMNFGPYDPVGDGEHQLCHLSLKDEQRISNYMVEFSRLACQLRGYGDGALWHLFYSGLPDRIKDEISW